MNDFVTWIGQAKETLETLAIVVGLSFNAFTICENTRERKISNLLSIADSHQKLWLQVTNKPELTRLLEKDVDLSQNPVSPAEQRFVHLLITHLAVSYAAMKAGMLPDMAGLRKDVRSFFLLPIPAHVWKWTREFQQPEFVAFIDSCLRED